MNLELDKYQDYKEKTLSGRYITNESVSKLKKSYNFSIIGKSSNDLPIFSLKMGTGPVKILIWSQMHGNESTSTKALFDCLSFFDKYETNVFSKVTLMIVPILNPDGAAKYTRENFNNVDLNRDAQLLTQIESKILRNLHDLFIPDFCFNLHDQRTIYSVKNKNSSILSFLSPSADTKKSETKSRKDSMKVIALIKSKLSLIIPDNISRYNDDYNKNCVGDTFQSLNTSTILFESGHTGQDYKREKTREYMCYALIYSIKSIVFKDFVKVNYKDYYLIPENTRYLCDMFLRNVKINNDNSQLKVDVCIMFKEVLDTVKKEIKFEPYIYKHGNLPNMSGHLIIDFNTIDKVFKISNNLVANELIKHVNKLRIIQ
ncbi:MAG: M14 family zinc carboxypeptidase [Flavobacteriales bacterium]